MKQILILFIVAVALFTGSSAFAAGTNDAEAELHDLVNKINADIQTGKRTEAALADDIKQFDNLLAEHKGEKTDDVAHILYMKATLYGEVIGDTAKSDELMKQLKNEFKDTEFVSDIEKMEAKHAAVKKIQDSLAIGTQFPDFKENDLQGAPMSIAKHKGKIVLVDFWATWCGPCRMELPNVISTYQTYHDKGFDVIGVSLDQDRSTLENFLKENQMPWQEFFDGKDWDNELAVKYGIEAIPMNFLLDGNGKIIAKGLRGEELAQAVAKALEK